MIKFWSENPNVILPTKGTMLAAGWDLYVPKDMSALIAPKGYALIETHLHVKLPIGWFGFIKERSSLGIKGLITTAGIIDCDYLNNTIKVAIFNLSNNEIYLQGGDRFAQLIPIPTLIETDDRLDSGGGFGSTGK
jgi:dUTP pyrophosphatase